MSRAPVLVFAYNRPDHLLRVLQKLSKNELADETMLIIHCDGPKPNSTIKERKRIQQVREIVQNFDWPSKKEVYFSEKNLGLARSIISGITKWIDIYEKVIVLEDDIETSPFFLKYMNDALVTYEVEKEVLSIGCCNFFAHGKGVPETFFLRIPDTWGWATWRDRWSLFEEDGAKLLNQLQQRKLENSFNLNGNFDYVQMLRDQIIGKNDSWAIRWQAVSYLNSKYVLYPGRSMTKNIGFDEQGTHTKGQSDQYANILLADQPINVDIQRPGLDSKIQKKLHLTFASMKSKQIPLRRLAKWFIPPIFISIFRYFFPEKQWSNPASKLVLWSGDYKSWEEVEADTDGYDTDLILEKVREALLKVKSKEVPYERDSVLFEKIEYSWPLLATLQKVAIENEKKLGVIDFGGSLGSTYFQNKDFLEEVELDWNVVEQPHFVLEGRKHFESSELSFYDRIEDCLLHKNISILLLSGVLQYLKNPYDWIEKFSSFGFDYVILDRTSMNSLRRDQLTAQWVPATIYQASYPCWFFSESHLLEAFTEKYNLYCEFNSHEGFSVPLEKSTGFYKGYVFRRKKI